jgi:hypothetical protein
MMADKRPELGRHRLERVTGIEPALSAWESDRSGPLTALIWVCDPPPVTAMDPEIPGLMARQWPGYPLWQFNDPPPAGRHIVADLARPELSLASVMGSGANFVIRSRWVVAGVAVRRAGQM